ncbi:19841_t:CDS:2, partial [Gigaspora margarita]
QSPQTSELFYENNDLFSEDFNFDNSDDVITTSVDLNNEQQKNLNIAYAESDQLQIMRKMNIYFLVKHNIATLNFENLCNLIELQIQNFEKNIIPGSASILNLPEPTTITKSTHVEYGSYINNHAGRQFITTIAHIIEEATLNELLTSKAWSLMIDEIFWYLDIIKLHSASSNAIFKDLDQFILAKHLPLEMLYHFGSDGASVNLVISALLEDSSKGQKTAQQLYNSTDQDFLIATHFLADILSQHCHLSLVFQTIYVSASEATMQVNAVIESITTNFIGEENMQTSFGTVLLRFINQQNISPEDLPSFVQEFAINTVKNIKLCFPDRVIVNSFRIFDLKQLPTDRYLLSTYRNYKITEIGNFYRKPACNKNFY